MLGGDAQQAPAGEQMLADADQSSADADQTSSDADQTSSDADQAGADRDQRASDQDQATADRDEASNAIPRLRTGSITTIPATSDGLGRPSASKADAREEGRDATVT